MPIYMPNQGWGIPSDLEQFKEVIAQVVKIEKNIDPDFEKKYFVYITVDQGKVEPQKAQRRTGWHGDSYLKIDSRKVKVEIPCDRVYVITDNCPTPFSPGPFSFENVNPENVDEVMAHFEKVSSGTTPEHYPSYTLLKLDPYCVHNVGFNNTDVPVFRTFVKISVSQNKYCKLGNAHNPLFTYDWAMTLRENVPYSIEALKKSSHRKDRDKFTEINSQQIDFNNNSSLKSWVKPSVLTVIKTGEIYAEPAQEGEMFSSLCDEFLSTINIAQKGDWKICSTHGEQYFITNEKLEKLYTKDPHCQSKYTPRPLERQAVQLTEDIRHMAPWGTLQYAKKGDWLLSIDKEDVYAVTNSRFHSEYTIATIKQLDLYNALKRQTEEHIFYLSQIGLAERAQGIKLHWFDFKGESIDKSKNPNLDSFSARMAIPQEVIDFDPNVKNTLITTDPEVDYNKTEDLERILDIRLYPALRNLINQYKLEVFLGTKEELVAYYCSLEAKILFRFEIPSSAEYYFVESSNGNYVMVMAGLVSRDNIIAQMITLKLAGRNLHDIEIIGDPMHFKTIVEEDIKNLLRKMPELKLGNHVLIVAGCGLEEKVNGIVLQKFNSKLVLSNSFKGDIVSLTCHHLSNPINGIHGFISLDLNYGEITEDIVALLLKQCHCTHVFTGGAGGYISKNQQGEKPPIGKRISITKCTNDLGEVVSVDSLESEPMHLQVSSIFLETFEWLEKAKKRGSSVDVETFYILKAIQDYRTNTIGETVTADCGCFVSDYVGEKALREYSKVYHHYEEALSKFLENSVNVLIK